MPNKILHIKHLDVGYTSKKKIISIAKNIDIDIKSPKLIALFGKNGIGKSTLLRTISRVQPQLQGEIFIDNQNINQFSNLELSKKISIVLTEKIPPNNLTVYELIALGRQAYTNWIGTLTQDDKLAINNAIDLTELNDISQKRVDELSDGQYQKMMIARALAQDTAIILLDEPTAHLDINNKVDIFNILKKLVTTQHKTVIISSHELQLALQVADDLWLMHQETLISGDKTTLIKNDYLAEIFDSKQVKFDKIIMQFVFH
jgi:iron complex transport system ATP-binding protein